MSIVMVPVIGIDTVMRMIEGYPVAVRNQVALAVDVGTFAAHGRAVQLSPYKTGRLRRGNKVRKVGGLSWILVNELYNDVPYALFVCYGTRKMRARDFMTPAVQYGRKTMMERFMAIRV